MSRGPYRPPLDAHRDICWAALFFVSAFLALTFGHSPQPVGTPCLGRWNGWFLRSDAVSCRHNGIARIRRGFDRSFSSDEPPSDLLPCSACCSPVRGPRYRLDFGVTSSIE